MTPEKILVTGGAGFIGSNFVRYWLDRYPDNFVVVLDLLTYAGNLKNLDGLEVNQNFRFIKGDICDYELVYRILRAFELDCIVHFAAESHVDRSITGPDAFVTTNIVGTHTLLKAARQVWLDEKKGAPHRFHHISTDEVYGSLAPGDPCFSEATPYAPNSPYSASKAASDHLVRSYHHTYGLNVTTTNCSNNYGAYQFPEKLIPLMILNCLRGMPLPVYGDGLNIRDWLHVDDHCKGIDMVIRGGRQGETYNIGCQCEKTNMEIVKAICGVIDSLFIKYPELAKAYPDCPAVKGKKCESLISFVKDRPGHDRRYGIDCSKIKTELGFTCVHCLDSGLEETALWYIKNETWWKPLC